tara:strand:- start:346 stop:555 length:210 start_codon:yes stop_codon:yes gene_type:complete
MNRTYEDMSKKELVTLVKRLTKQHDEWSAAYMKASIEAKRLREGIKRIANLAVQRNARHTEKGLLELIE